MANMIPDLFYLIHFFCNQFLYFPDKHKCVLSVGIIAQNGLPFALTFLKFVFLNCFHHDILGSLCTNATTMKLF